MKKLLHRLNNRNCLLLLLVILLSCFATNVSANPIYWDNAKYFGANVGWTRLGLNAGTFDVATIEFTCFPSKQAGFEFSSKIYAGKDYVAFEPISAAGTLMTIFVQARQNEFNKTARMFAMLLAVSGAKVPIYPIEWMEITPSWSLCKLTWIYDQKVKVSGNLGGEIKFFPFCYLPYVYTMYISGHAHWEFGYKKDAGNYYYYEWADAIIRGDKSLFRGWSAGITLGMYF